VARFWETIFCCGSLVGSGIAIGKGMGEDNVQMKLMPSAILFRGL
jgi:hypothetical protein